MMDNDDEIIIIDSEDEEWAASFAPKPILNGVKASIAGGDMGVGPLKRSEPEKYDEGDDDDIEIVEEKTVVRRIPTPVQPIQLTAEAQKKILLEASKNFMKEIQPASKITRCSIVVGNKKAAEAEAKLRMEQKKKESDAVLRGRSSKRKFGTELVSSKKSKHENKDSKVSISGGSKRNSSDQENKTPTHSELRNGHPSGDVPEVTADSKSFNGSFVSYVQRFTEGHQNRGPVAKKTASVIEPSWGLALSSMKTQYTKFLAKEVDLKQRNGILYVSSGLFSKVYSNFTLEMDLLQKKLKELTDHSKGNSKGATKTEPHFLYSGWIISYISLRAAITIVDAMGKKPAVVYSCLRDLHSVSQRKVVLIDDISGGTRKPKPLPGTQLSDLSEEEFGDIFGLCTHEKAEKILMAKRQNKEGEKGSRKMMLRAKMQEGSDHPSRARKKLPADEPPLPPDAEFAKMCTGRVKPLFRTTRGSQGGVTAATRTAETLKARRSAQVTKETSRVRTTVENQTLESPVKKALPQRTYDAPPFDPQSGKIVHNPPDVVHLCRTPLLDRKGIRFPDGWFIRGKLKPDKTRYHFYYHSPDGKRFKNYQEAINYCLENGHSMSDLNSSQGTVPKKRKIASCSKPRASPHAMNTGKKTSGGDKAQDRTISDTSNAIQSQGKVKAEAAESQIEQEKTAQTVTNTAKERFKYIAVRKFPVNVSQPTSRSSPAPITATDDDCSPAVGGKSMISKKKKRSLNSNSDLIDGTTTMEGATVASVRFNLATFRPLPFRSVDGWFSTKVSGLRRIVHEAEKEAGVNKKVNLSHGSGGLATASSPVPTTPAPAARAVSPVASDSTDSPSSSKPELERRGINEVTTPSVTYSEGLAAMTDLHEWRHARARAMQYSSAAERKASAAAAARVRKQELVAKKIADCSATAAPKRRGARAAYEEELCLPPGCYKRSASRSTPASADAAAAAEERPMGRGAGVLYCNADGKTFESLSKLWAEETADEDSRPENEFE